MKLALAFVFSLISTFTVNAATEVATGAEFKEKLTADPTGDYVLTADIDLTGTGYATIPVFSGKLDGAGYTITGLGANSLFNIFGGSIEKLILDGTVSGKVTTRTATSVGMFCNKSHGGKFTDVVLKGYHLKASALYYHNGLFADQASDGTEFIRCQTDASCTIDQNSKSNTHLGGFVGVCAPKLYPAVDIVFEDCTNNAAVKFTGNYNGNFGCGGFVGYISAGTVAPVPRFIFKRCVNNGAVTATGNNGYMGGLVGLAMGVSSKEKTNRMFFLDCVNKGVISTTSSSPSYAGGILGGATAACSALFDGCVNQAAISFYGKTAAGGLIGYFGQYMSSVSGANDITIRNCENHGDVSGRLYVGGLICSYDTNTGWGTGKLNILNSANYGTLSSSDVTDSKTGVTTYGTNAEAVCYLNYNNTMGLIDNCWGKTDVFYAKKNMSTPTVSNCKSLSDDTALVDLNAIAAETDNYLPWATGSDTYPHLAQFVDTELENVTVVFRDFDGTILKEESVAKGGTATPPENPSRDGYTFSKWDGVYAGVTSPTSVYAVYTIIPNTVTLTFDAAGGEGGKSVVTTWGAYVYAPTVSLFGHQFVGWMDNGLLTDHFASAGARTLTALWRKVKEPYSRQVNFLTWHLKSCDKTSCESRGAALKTVFDEHDVDIATVIGLSSDSTQLGKIIAKLPGYSYTTTWQNGSADGNGRTIFWKTSRFDKYGSASYKQPTSNSTLGYVPLKMKSRHLIFLPMAAFYSTTKTIAEYMNGFSSVPTSLATAYPTAIQLFGTDYSKAKDTATLISTYTDWAGLRDVFVNKHGYTELEASDDFQWTFIKSPWSPSTLTNLGSTKVENADNQDQPGYVTSFKIGVYDPGVMVIIR